LQRVGILEFVDEDVLEARLVMIPERLVARQQFVAAQQQLGEITTPSRWDCAS